MSYTREQLIEICEAAVVPEEKWRDRDSQVAQEGVGKCWALLKAGCRFSIGTDTNNRTIWLDVESKGFNYFECGGLERDIFYLPTPERLKESEGRDWY